MRFRRGYAAALTSRRRKHWGWGYEDEQPSIGELRAQAAFLSGHLGYGSHEPEPFVALRDCTLRPPRLRPPAALAPICDQDDHTRARHALGSSYRDVVRGFRGRFDHPPDVVARPRDEREVSQVLDWAIGAGAAVIPYGGGTSVCGGVEPDVDERFGAVVTVDLGAMDRVLEVDPTGQSARIQAGATGPRLEDQLRDHGLTLRHFPQSFQFATLGGMIATRAAGHFATVDTHIDDLVESVRAITPNGIWDSRRLPGSGAGISPDRMLIGSEGTLGVITEAWVRLRARPAVKAARAVRFPDFLRGAAAVRAIVQAGLAPSNCRLIDPVEARLTGAGDGTCALLVLGFESPAFDVGALMEQAVGCCRDHDGTPEERGAGGDDEPAGGGATMSWRDAFLRAPYLRDVFVAMGVLSETFESAITWDRFEALHAEVGRAVGEAVTEICGAGGVTCRFTHVYPDGPALYWTVLAPARAGEELAQWEQIKRVASDTLIAGGATITHHHAVGRDHRPWYDRQRPDPFALALRGAKAALDPAGALNPGVLIDP
jgi:alkyldihydroxyacetonephosphate synthase